MGREALVWLVRGLVATLLVVGTSACAQRADWIEGTLVTVNVSGVWRGTLRSAATFGEVEITLTQRGPKVTGGGRFRAMKFSLEGTVRGDVFSFSESNGRLRAEATVAGDEMSGEGWTNFTPPVFLAGTYRLSLSRQR